MKLLKIGPSLLLGLSLMSGHANALRSGELVVDSVPLPCPWTETSADVFKVTCANGLLTLSNLKGTITNSRTYSLNTDITNLSDAINVPALDQLIKSNLFTGINTADVTLQGPDNSGGSNIKLKSTVGFGTGFAKLDQAIKGMSGVSFRSRTYPVTTTLNNQAATVTVVLHNPATASPITFKAPTGTTTKMSKLWVEFESTGDNYKISANADTQIKLTDADTYADMKIGFGVAADGNVFPSGTIANLKNPFGVIPVNITAASFTGELTPEGSMDAMSIQATNARLFDTLPLTGGFAYDTGDYSFSANAKFTLCGTSNALKIASAKPELIPKQMLDVVTNIGKTLSNCVERATCPTGYTKTGLQCDKTCPSPSKNTPGICDFGVGTVGSCPAPLTGLKPSCINPDNANPLKWPM